MSVGLEELVKLAERHVALYETMAGLLSIEQAALIDMDLEKIQQVSKAKETTALKIRLQVPAMAEAIADMAVERGLDPEPLPTLSEIAGKVPAPYNARLEKAGLSLARIKRGITRHNEDNHTFVRTALDMISGSMAAITRAVTGERNQGYTAKGQKSEGVGRRPVRLSREV